MFIKTALVCAFFATSVQIVVAQAVVQPACFMKVFSYDISIMVEVAVLSDTHTVPSSPNLQDITQPTRKLFAVKKQPSSSHVSNRIYVLLGTSPPPCLHIRRHARRQVMAVCCEVLSPPFSNIISWIRDPLSMLQLIFKLGIRIRHSIYIKQL